MRQVNYWRQIRLIEPVVARRISARNEVRLYDFTGLVELRIVAALRSRLSLQHIRQVIDRLRRSYDRPLTELRFAVQGRSLYFQHPDGTWEGDRRPGQIVMAEVIMLEKVRADLRRAAAEHDREPGRIVRRRRVHASRPTFAAVTARRVLVEAGHDCWTAADANLHDAPDDALAVYAADRSAALVSHDAAFARRRQHTIGQHIWLRCSEPHAPAVLRQHLEEIAAVLRRMSGVVIEVRPDSRTVSPPRWE